jgi:1-acyl-sn-glycerol-3-phosphate acyltransferase
MFYLLRLAAKLMRLTLTRLFSLKFTVENTKYFQINQPYIVICNHQSALDLLSINVERIL